MSEIQLHHPAPDAQIVPTGRPLPEKLEYVKVLAHSGMLPRQYQNNPGNLLFAVEYAEMLGCHPMQAVTGIHVIDGKPSASAALISAMIRRAGHRLRVTFDPATMTATAQIIRADDPEFTFSAVWDMKRAKDAGLAGKKGPWQQYPAAMLKARAITEVAREACEDALMGVSCTPEELNAVVDQDGNVISEGDDIYYGKGRAGKSQFLDAPPAPRKRAASKPPAPTTAQEAAQEPLSAARPAVGTVPIAKVVRSVVEAFAAEGLEGEEASRWWADRIEGEDALPHDLSRDDALSIWEEAKIAAAEESARQKAATKVTETIATQQVEDAELVEPDPFDPTQFEDTK